MSVNPRLKFSQRLADEPHLVGNLDDTHWSLHYLIVSINTAKFSDDGSDRIHGNPLISLEAMVSESHCAVPYMHKRVGYYVQVYHFDATNTKVMGDNILVACCFPHSMTLRSIFEIEQTSSLHTLRVTRFKSASVADRKHEMK